jgi:hypothetical protein
MIYFFIVAVNIILPLPGQQFRVDAFVPTCHQPRSAITTSTFGRKGKTASSSLLWYAESPEDSLSEMKASDMKKELEESYGVSTKSMFDKKEFEKALKDARLNSFSEKGKARAATTTTNEQEEEDKQESTSSNSSGKETTSVWGKPKTGDDNNKNETRENWSSRWKDVASTAKEVLDSNVKKFSDYASSKDKSSSSSSSSPSSSSSSSSTSSNTRQQRYDLALEEGAAMKLSSLKSELKDRGISTASFFEKSDLINAYANAIADNINSNKRSTKSTNTNRSSNNDTFDPSYRTVIMHSFDPSSFLSGEVIIDTTSQTVH